MGTLFLGLNQQISPQDPRFGTHAVKLMPSGAERLAREAVEGAIKKADENPTLKTAAVATTVTAGTTLLLWSQPTARAALRNLAGNLWRKGSATASALLGKQTNQATTALAASSNPPTQTMSAAKDLGKNLMTRAAARTESSSASSSTAAAKTATQAIHSSTQKPENVPLTWRDKASNLRNKLPSKKTVATGAMILGGTAATVFLGRFALSKAGYNVRLPLLDPLVEKAQTWGGKLQESLIHKLEGLEAWIRRFSAKKPTEEEMASHCYGDKSTDGCYNGKEIPTGLPESNCDSMLGYTLGEEAQTFLGQRPEAFEETCKRMDESLKAIGFKKPINNISPKEDLPEIKKLYRKWALGTHSDKGGTDEQFSRVSDQYHKFMEFFENKQGTRSDWNWIRGEDGLKKVLVPRKTEQSLAERKATAEKRAEEFLHWQKYDLEKYIDIWKDQVARERLGFNPDDYMNKFPEDSPYIKKKS